MSISKLIEERGSKAPRSVEARRAALNAYLERAQAWEACSKREQLELGCLARDEAIDAAPDARLLTQVAAKLGAISGEPSPQVDGVVCSPYPYGAQTLARFVELEAVPLAWRGAFARRVVGSQTLLVAFVEPAQLHYRCFENILPLDRALGATKPALSLREVREHEALKGLFLARVEDEAQLLAWFLGLELYDAPQNSAQRGGERFIFYCDRLSVALDEAIRQAMPQPFLEGFVHVNPVFRANRFKPGDAPFHPHWDSPYYDEAQAHVSRYTMLLYVDEGHGAEGAPALEVAGVELNKLPAMTCVIFDQRFEHAGAPFAQGLKRFLRTELIFSCEGQISHDPRLGQRFNKACYLTSQSVGAEQLQAQAQARFNEVAKARFGGELQPQADEVYLVRRYRDEPYITNGYDYWFLAERLALEECATLAILDQLNGKIGGESFQKAVSTLESIQLDWREDVGWVGARLLKERAVVERRRQGREEGEPLFVALPKEAMFAPPAHPDPWQDVPVGEISEFHEWLRGGEPYRAKEIIELYVEAQRRAKALLRPAPFYVLGDEVFLDRARFVVHADKIHVLSDQRARPLNFAAMSYYEIQAEHYVADEVSFEAASLLVPPILYRREGPLVHLMLDFFRSDWMFKAEPQAVGIPKILGAYEGATEL